MGKYNWVRVTGDQVLSLHPVSLGAVIVTPDAGERGLVTLYDGESADDPRLISIATGAGTTKVVNINPVMVTHRGLYIDVGDNVTEALVYFFSGKE